MKELTPAQLENLKTLAGQVKGDYAELDITDILNRIHLITNRGYDKCIEGFKIMMREGLITAPFVRNLERLPSLEKAIVKAMPIMDALDAKIVKAGEFESLGKVTQVVTSILDGPPDDEPDPVHAGINLSHIDSNY